MKQYVLSDVLEIISGGTPKTSVAEYWNGAIPWLSVKDFNNNQRYVYKTEKTITEAGLKNSATTLLRKGDIILSARGTVGEMATIPFPMAFNQSCYGLRAKHEFITDDFLYYLLKCNISSFKKISHGSVFDTITKDTFNNITVCLPELDTQKKIASMLSALDSKIEQNTAINNNLEQQAQALFKSWFVDFEPFGGAMPANWTSAPLSKFIGLTQGKYIKDVSPTKTDTYKYLVYGGGGIRGYTTECTHKVPSVIVGCRGTCGIVSRTFQPASITNSVISFDIEKYFGINFLYFYLKNRGLEEFISGSAVPQITKTALNNISLLVPDEVILNKFENIASAFYENITKNIIENERLAAIRDALLPKLMSGEVDVSKVDISDPGCLDKSLFNKETE